MLRRAADIRAAVALAAAAAAEFSAAGMGRHLAASDAFDVSRRWAAAVLAGVSRRRAG